MSEEQRLEARLRTFAAAPDTGAEWEDVLRRAGERLPARRFDRRRLVLALAAAIVVAASLAVVFVAHGTRGTSLGSPAGPTGTLGLGPLPTLARPLPVPGAEQVSLSDAVSAFGGRLVLPDIPQAGPVGTVWLVQPHLGPTFGNSSTAGAAVTFPAAGVWVNYEKGVNVYTDDVLLEYQALARQEPNTEVIDLNGVPAVVYTPTEQESNGFLQFSAAGITVAIIGPGDPTTMREMAQSIVDRSEAAPRGQLGNVDGIQLFPYFPPARQIDLADASATFGATIVLPDMPLANASNAGAVWTERSCPAPHGDDDTARAHACWLWISFPSSGLSVGYLRPPMYRGNEGEWKLQARLYGDNAHEVELGGVPALAIEPRDPYPGSVEFDLDGTRIVVAGAYDTATLQDVAQSIVDRAAG